MMHEFSALKAQAASGQSSTLGVLESIQRYKFLLSGTQCQELSTLVSGALAALGCASAGQPASKAGPKLAKQAAAKKGGAPSEPSFMHFFG